MNRSRPRGLVRHSVAGASNYARARLTLALLMAPVITGLSATAPQTAPEPPPPTSPREFFNAGTEQLRAGKLREAEASLETALGSVRRLTGLLPICAYCKAIRDDSDYWHRVEEYVSEHADVQFSHGICPDCLEHAMKVARLAGQDFAGS